MSAEMLAILAGLARQRQAALDDRLTAWRQGPGAGVHLWCRSGCANCCTLAVNATLPEALAIASRLDTVQQERLAATVTRISSHARQSADARVFLAGYRRAVGPCPFLDDTGNCGIYPRRPLACRALFATRPPDWCGINLAELPEIERRTFLASLDRATVAFPSHYAAAPRELAADDERGLLLAMVRHAGFAVTGNLALLVWLSGQAGAAAAVAGGADAFLAYLASGHLDRPFLVQLDRP